MKLIFDGHLDLAWNALSWNRDLTESVRQLRHREAAMSQPARKCVTTSLPEMRKARVAVCLGTLLARAKRNVCPSTGHLRTDLDHGTRVIACAITQGQLAYYRLLENRREMLLIRDSKQLSAHWKKWKSRKTKSHPIGLILSMEGADPIIAPSQVEAWWSDGLRVVGMAHYGQCAYACGTGKAGPLTAEGRELLREFKHCGMILDMTHLSEPGFFEALDHFAGRVLASHNNCRALVPGDRQFSDEQIRLLIKRNAVIGSVMDAWMLHPGWVAGRTSRKVVGLEAVADHMDHICQLAGNANHVAIGSDLDGGFGADQCPRDLETIVDLHKLEPILKKRGYREEDIVAIFHGNWLRFFLEALPRDG